MGDKKAETLAKARLELEEMYSGIPEESVELTFQHLANLTQTLNRHSSNSSNDHQQVTNTNTNSMPLSTLSDQQTNNNNITVLRKIPSFDFSQSIQQPSNNNDNNNNHNYNHHHHHHGHHHHHHHRLERINEDGKVRFSHHGHSNNVGLYHGHAHTSGMSGGAHSCIGDSGLNQHALESSSMDVSMAASMVVGRRRRPGIPHSKICTVCNTYTYIFRHRCLVCGRAYCRQCVRIGMGEMQEGRKCIECLGRRFSQRYIHKAGEVGCFCARYPTGVRQTELKWAEKGPKRSGEKGYGRSGIVSRSRSPIGPMSSNGPQMSPEPTSFVMSSTYSPYTPSHHHYPF